MNVLKHKKYTPGQVNLALVAVFSMFAGSKLVALKEFLRALISMHAPLAKPFIQVTESLRTPYIKDLMDQSLRGPITRVDNGTLVSRAWDMMWPFLKAHQFAAVRRC